MQFQVPVLNGLGLIVRPWQRGDAPALVEMMNDPGVNRYLASPLPYPYTSADSVAFIEQRVPEDAAAGRQAHLAIVDAATGEPVGSVAAKPLDEQGVRIGYVVGAAFGGQRIAARASRLMAEWAASEGLWADLVVNVRNSGSVRSALLAGFEFAGRTTNDGRDEFRLVWNPRSTFGAPRQTLEHAPTKASEARGL